jgi:hypothetical protein
MSYIRTQSAYLRRFVLATRTISVVVMAAIFGLSAPSSTFADPPMPGLPFARKYTAVFSDPTAKANPALMVRGASFRALLEAQSGRGNADVPARLIGGIHQGSKAVTIGSAAGRPVRFEYSPGHRIILQVGDQSIVTGLLAAQARPMARVVEDGNNGLVTLSERAEHNGKHGYRPNVAASFLDTEEGHWLLWADAISEDLFYSVDFGKGRFPDGLTIVDSERPVTISTDHDLEVRGGEPWVAFWNGGPGRRGTILRYEDYGRVMEPRSEHDERAMEAVRRVFKWAPVMRLAAESDPAAFKTFVRQLEQVRIPAVNTPRLLIEE